MYMYVYPKLREFGRLNFWLVNISNIYLKIRVVQFYIQLSQMPDLESEEQAN
jgi:hypothetical protein